MTADAIALVKRTTSAQNLPERVTDPLVLARIARVLRQPPVPLRKAA